MAAFNHRTLEDQVMELVAADVEFERIEEFIDQAPAASDYKAALWLLAWAELPRVVRRTVLMAY